MIKHVIVVAGGSPSNWPDLSTIERETSAWIGIDRGAYYLLQEGIIPELAVGDFDSLNAEEMAHVKEIVPEVQVAQPEKDDTDTQLGIVAAFKRYPEAEVKLIGGTGGRLDHFLANLWLPFEPRFQTVLPQITLCDRQNSITYFKPGRYELRKESDKKYVAFVCMTPVSDLTLRNFKYALTKHQATYPISFASNEFITASASFSFTAGLVAVIQSRD